MKPMTVCGIALFGVCLSMPLGAQPASDMRDSVELLRRTLEEGLGLNERRGVFSPRAGNIRGRYLAGQGMVLEILTPQQTRAAAPGENFSASLAQLSAQLDNLVQRGNLSRPDFEGIRDQLALSMRSDEVAVFYRDLIQQLSQLQDIPAIERSLSSAAAALRSLQALGQLEPARQQQLLEQLQNQRTQLQQHLLALESLRLQIREQIQQSEALPDAALQQAWAETRAGLTRDLTQLQASIAESAEQLQLQRAQAEGQQQQQAAVALQDFQSRLFQLLCDYAGGLRALPDGEQLNLVLLGVGDEFGEGLRRDLVYRLGKDRLRACQQGQLDGEQLQRSAFFYQY